MSYMPLRKNEKYLPWLCLGPGLILSLGIIIVPVFWLFKLSLYESNAFGQIKGFSGYIHFAEVISDPVFIKVTIRSFFWTFFVVSGTIAISVPVAIILNQEFFGKSIARIIVMLPWAISLTMSAIVWKWILNGEYGLLNLGLLDLGIIASSISFLSDSSVAFALEVFIGIIVSVPFTVVIFLSGLTSIPGDIYQSSALEGASNFQSFKRLTLPFLKPYINIAVVLNIIYVFNSFPVIWVITEGGPGNETDLLVTYLYKLAFRMNRLGEASVISIFMFIFLIGFTLFYLKLTGNEKKQGI